MTKENWRKLLVALVAASLLLGVLARAQQTTRITLIEQLIRTNTSLRGTDDGTPLLLGIAGAFYPPALAAAFSRSSTLTDRANAFQAQSDALVIQIHEAWWWIRICNALTAAGVVASIWCWVRMRRA